MASSYREAGHDVVWVDDTAANREIVRSGDVIVAANVAARELPRVRGVNYILHNLPDWESLDDGSMRVLNLQVWTKDSRGEYVGSHGCVQYDESSRTLFQPWGVPVSTDRWLRIRGRSRSRFEFFMGSIWNNSLGQGNRPEISDYRKELRRRGIVFLRVGGTRWLPGGLTEEQGLRLVSLSRLGATVAGRWQQEHLYVPCRLFKSIAAGVPPSTNIPLPQTWNSGILTCETLPDLVEKALAESPSDAAERSHLSQAWAQDFTYSVGLQRMLAALFC